MTLPFYLENVGSPTNFRITNITSGYVFEVVTLQIMTALRTLFPSWNLRLPVSPSMQIRHTLASYVRQSSASLRASVITCTSFIKWSLRTCVPIECNIMCVGGFMRVGQSMCVGEYPSTHPGRGCLEICVDLLEPRVHAPFSSCRILTCLAFASLSKLSGL